MRIFIMTRENKKVVKNHKIFGNNNRSYPLMGSPCTKSKIEYRWNLQDLVFSNNGYDIRTSLL